MKDTESASEPKYGVMSIDIVQINSVEVKMAKGGKPCSVSMQSGQQFFLRHGGHMEPSVVF